MLKTLNTDYLFEDERGLLCQIYHNAAVQINVLKTKKGVERGNHFHKLSTEYFYVASGKLTVICEENGVVQKNEFITNDFFVIYPNTAHKMIFDEDTILVAFYDRPIEDELGNKDIFKR